MEQTTARRRIVTAKNYNELCVRTIDAIFNVTESSIGGHGRCAIALSGGITPQGIYSMMAADAYRTKFQWDRIHFFLGDERWVPADSLRSNGRMISELLIKRGNISASQFHPVNTNTADPNASAELYEKEIKEFFKIERGAIPRFDLMLQGIGDDGHTASLFPGVDALNEKKKSIVAVHSDTVPEPRITVTFPVINNAKDVFFIVSGKGKSSILAKILNDNAPVPAAMVKPTSGTATWFVDSDAASMLG